MKDNMEPMFADAAKQRDNTIDIRGIFLRIREYWLFILVCVVVSMLCGYFYLRYTTPKYIADAKVLIKTGQKDAANGALLEELGVHGSNTNAQNEVEVFRSRILMRRVVDGMHLNIAYYVPGKIQTTSLYDDAPFRMVPLFNDSSIKSSHIYKIHRQGIDYTITEGSKNWNVRLGDSATISVGTVRIESNPFSGHLYDNTNDFKVIVFPPEDIVDAYLGGLVVDLINKQGNIITLSLKDAIPRRAEDVLNRLIEEYQKSNIEDKNQVADGTIDFINQRLSGIGTELTGVEKTIENFKSSNNLTDVEAQSKLLLDNTSDNTKELMQKEVQLRVLESLERYVQDGNNMRRVMPATLIAQDPTLIKIIEDYNNLQNERQRLLMSYTEASAYVKNVDQQLEELRSGMRSYISSLRRSYQVTVDELKSKSSSIASGIRQVPEKQRILLDYTRQQQIKQELYVFLLKKKEDMSISRSATVSSLKIIDPAKKEPGPISPKRSRVYLMAFVIGLIVPGIRIGAKELFNTRITGKRDIDKLTNMPILAEIGHSKHDEAVIVKNDSRTVIAEQFRALRTNLQFLMAGDDKKVIMVTSSMSGEGKSFVSINLAATIALAGKKVVLMELDLRKPQISQHLNIKQAQGFSNYVIGQSTLDDIITPTGLMDNFFVISAGPIPPNPSEIILMPKVAQLFNALKEQFDYIVIDTPPVGLVTDAQLLSNYADVAAYVIRQEYTFKEQLKNADNLYQRGRLKNMGLIVNDVKTEKGGDYGYGYGSGYFDEEKGSAIKKVFKRK